jgi:hypothetical protein
MTADVWPSLQYEEWRATRDTLHMYTQVVGKLRLALSPFEPEWANVPLYVTARGLTTSPLPVGLRAFDAEFDLVDHVLLMRTSDGEVERLPLGGAVADFYGDVMAALQRMRIDVAISVLPSEVTDPIPFPDDRTHNTYDAAQAARFHRVLSMVDLVLKEHRARFRGRTTPVHFFWGTFDLALTRYSGRLVDPAPDAGVIARFGGDAEEICAGWWPGDQRSPHPAFFCYAYPAPEHLEDVAIQPPGAAWSATAGEFLLPYDTAREALDPRQVILDFLDSTYRGAATMLGWNGELTGFRTPTAAFLDTARRTR